MYVSIIIIIELRPGETETFKTGKLMIFNANSFFSYFLSLNTFTQSLIGYIDGCHGHQSSTIKNTISHRSTSHSLYTHF